MVITYLGNSYFKLTLGDLTIAINPPDKSLKPTRFGADIALITTQLPTCTGVDTVSLGEKQPFVISGPGSYEVSGLHITGIAAPVSISGTARINTIYGFELDGIKIAFLGYSYDDKSLSAEAKEMVSLADMIFIPIGEEPNVSYKTAVSFEPNMIIPYHYDSAALARFLKEGGQEKTVPEEKLTIKRRDLDGKQGEIVVLAAGN